MDEEIKYERLSTDRVSGKTTKIQIVARKPDGWRQERYKIKYPEIDWDKDRLIFLRLIDIQKNISVEIPYSHKNQIKLLKLVINNVLLPHIKEKDIGKFKDAIEELEKEEK